MKNLILILTMLTFFACNDSVSEDIQFQDPESKGNLTILDDYYATGYHLGTADADWLVDQTWSSGKCMTMEFEPESVQVPIVYITGSNGGGFNNFVMNDISLKKISYDCMTSTVTQELAFDEFISIYPYKDGYTQILEQKINVSTGTNKAFYEGILAGFKNRLCGWSITMPFNFTNCDEIDLPTSVGGSGSGSGLGDPPCIRCSNNS